MQRQWGQKRKKMGRPIRTSESSLPTHHHRHSPTTAITGSARVASVGFHGVYELAVYANMDPGSARPMQRCRRDERAERARARRTRAHSASRAHHVHNPYRSRCQRRQQHSCHQNICMLTTSRSPSSSRCRRVKVNVTKVHESERLALAARLRHPTHPSSIKRAAEHVDANIVVHASGSAASGRRRRIALLFSR